MMTVGSPLVLISSRSFFPTAVFVVDEEAMDPSEGQFLCWPLFDLHGVFELLFEGEYLVRECGTAGDDDPDVLMYVP